MGTLALPPLSAQQFKLLWVLYENQGQVLSRADLISVVWGEDQSAGVSDQALERDRARVLDTADSGQQLPDVPEVTADQNPATGRLPDLAPLGLQRRLR